MTLEKVTLQRHFLEKVTLQRQFLNECAPILKNVSLGQFSYKRQFLAKNEAKIAPKKCVIRESVVAMSLSRESVVAMTVSHVQTTDSWDAVIRHDKCQILEKVSLQRHLL